MQDFMVKYQRYDNRAGESRVMTDFVQADSLRGALVTAEYAARLMQDADPTRRFSVVSVAQRNIAGIETTSGWMTAEEFSAHVRAKNVAAAQ